MMLKANVGSTDSVVRIAFGLGLLLAAGAVGFWWGLVGLVPLVTGFLRYCPAYSLLGIDTNHGNHVAT